MKKISTFLMIPFMCLYLLANVKSQTILITGAHPGTAEIKGKNLCVHFKGLDISYLSEYEDVRPYVGGTRIMIYFDTDKNTKGAELCAYLYKRSLLLKKSSDPGFYNITLQEIGIIKKKDGVRIYIPIELLGKVPIKIWTP